MKQFIAGIIATVVGGILLFIATDQYNKWANSRKFDIEFQSSPAAAFLRPAEMNAIAAFLKNVSSNSGKIGIVRIENKLEDDIRNAKFIISPTEESFSKTNLHGFGLASHVASDMPDPKLTLKDDGIHVEFPVLKGRNGSFIWILHEPPQGFKVYSESDEFNMSEFNRWDQSDSEFDLFFIFLIGGVFFVVGIFGGNSMAMHVVKEAGYDPKKINADYYRKLAKKEEEKSSQNKDDDA